jgi:signal peptidase I
MYPTLEDGDNLLIDKISYRFQEPERFDIIVFQYPHAQNTYYIKRIIGLPGETVLIQDGQIYINGELLEDPYGAEPMENPGRAYRQITLGPGEYFVLGDNRNVSSDSRDSSVGNVTTEQIVGKVFLRIYPWKQMGKVE